MKKAGESDSEGVPTHSSPPVGWIDTDDPAARPSNGVLLRAASLLAGLWLFAGLLIAYVVVPCTFVVVLAVLVLVLRVHPLIGGILFALGIGFGVGYYFDEVLR